MRAACERAAHASTEFTPTPVTRSALHLVPQRIQLLEPALRHVDPALRRQPLDRREPRRELRVRLVERERRVHAGLAAQVHHREQQVAELRLERACARRAPARRAACARRRDRAARRAPRASSSSTFARRTRRHPASRSRRRRRDPAAGCARCSDGQIGRQPLVDRLSRFFAFIRSHGWRSPPSYRCGCRAFIFVMRPSATSSDVERAALLGDHRVKEHLQQQVAELLAQQRVVARRESRRRARALPRSDRAAATRASAPHPTRSARADRASARAYLQVLALSCIASSGPVSYPLFE